MQIFTNKFAVDHLTPTWIDMLIKMQDNSKNNKELLAHVG